MSFIDSDETYYDSEEDFEPSNEDISEEVDESDIEPINIFPITAHRKKYIVKYYDFEYY